MCGHTLGEEDLRVMYAFAKKSDKYETDSDVDVLVLLDCTPDQAMLDEGVSREVVNRFVKNNKSAHESLGRRACNYVWI